MEENGLKEGHLNRGGITYYRYRVTSGHVSFHLPLHRLLSTLIFDVGKRCEEAYEKEREMEEREEKKEEGRQDEEDVTMIDQEEDNNNTTATTTTHPPLPDPSALLSSLLPLSQHQLLLLLSHPLRIRVFLAQIQAGMWRKNGEITISGQMNLYTRPAYTHDSLPLDTLIMQVIYQWIIHKYNIINISI